MKQTYALCKVASDFTQLKFCEKIATEACYYLLTKWNDSVNIYIYTAQIKPFQKTDLVWKERGKSISRAHPLKTEKKY